MSGIFLDTGYLIALIHKKDNLHKIAVEASKKFHGFFLTTQLVLVEIANSLSLPENRHLAVSIIEKIRDDPHTTVVSFSSEGFEKALAFYKKRSDKSWGMIDCFSFMTMEEFDIKQELTFDEHFKQAGYSIPLL